MKLFTTDTVDPFVFDRLYGNEKYSLNGMQMKAVNFPAEVDPDKATVVWSDRVITAWWEAAQKVESTYTGDAFLVCKTTNLIVELIVGVIGPTCSVDYIVDCAPPLIIGVDRSNHGLCWNCCDVAFDE